VGHLNAAVRRRRGGQTDRKRSKCVVESVCEQFLDRTLVSEADRGPKSVFTRASYIESAAKKNTIDYSETRSSLASGRNSIRKGARVVVVVVVVAMPRSFLVAKPRPLAAEQVPAAMTSSPPPASPWQPLLGRDVNNNSVPASDRSSLSLAWRPARLDLSAAAPRWSIAADCWTAGAAEFDATAWRGPGHRDRVEVTSNRAAAAAADDVTRHHLFWSSSPHSDVSATGLELSYWHRSRDICQYRGPRFRTVTSGLGFRVSVRL